MADETEESLANERQLRATFEQYDEFVALQTRFLAFDLSNASNADNVAEHGIRTRMKNILLSYLEQAYLLDPLLERLVVPVIQRFRQHVRDYVANPNQPVATWRIHYLSSLIHDYISFRGYKTIIRFFPHEVSDVPIVLKYFSVATDMVEQNFHWPLRYVLLVWLSLLCMIPFDLARFDAGDVDADSTTASEIEKLGKRYLNKAGLEREAASLMFSRLYARTDTLSRFPAFMDWSKGLVTEAKDVFSPIGVLHAFCELAKTAPADMILPHLSQMMEILRSMNDIRALTNNTVVRKFKTKLATRVALRLLPPKSGSRTRSGRLLSGGKIESEQIMEQDETDVPEEVEGILAELFEALQDKDTVVRWSAAKGIARIAEVLPSDFCGQVLDTILGLFEIHSSAVADEYNLPALAEAEWHGACLACAEIARRGLIPDERFPTLFDWLIKSLYFDIRKGAHSVGSSVRDAASYVLWSLARATHPASLAPYAESLARNLVAVSTYDREIHIRRAASAAFQENVGRMSLFPHGIDVLRKTDFYAVSLRKNAFLLAAPQVAEHTEYRQFLFDHVTNITLRHWDVAMRQLGARSVKALCLLDWDHLFPEAVKQSSKLLQCHDSSDIHGGLLTLVELASGRGPKDPDKEAQKKQIFKLLNLVPITIIQSPRNDQIAEVVCHLIAASITAVDIGDHTQASSVPHWRTVVDLGLKHRNAVVQDSAAIAMARVKFSGGSPAMQQSLARLLGVLDYTAHSHNISAVVRCLVNSVGASSPSRFANVEARVNCFVSISQVLVTVQANLPRYLSAETVQNLIRTLLNGMEDYTTDERGDVGSWIRLAAVKGLRTVFDLLLDHASTIPNFSSYCPPQMYHDAIAGMLKQGVERLDNVRQQAGEQLFFLSQRPLPEVANAEEYRIQGESVVKSIFSSDPEEEMHSWSDGEWLYPKAVQLLGIPRYRQSLLAGFVLSAHSKTDSTQRPISTALVAYADSLPVVAATEEGFDLVTLMEDIIAPAQRNTTSNNIVIPVLHTLGVFAEADAFDRLPGDPRGKKLLTSILSLTGSNISRLKSVTRILTSMKTLVNLLSVHDIAAEVIPKITDYLSHRFPKVRTDTAEVLYIVLQTKDIGQDTEEVEQVILETDWTMATPEAADKAAKRVEDLLRELASP